MRLKRCNKCISQQYRDNVLNYHTGSLGPTVARNLEAISFGWDWSPSVYELSYFPP